MMKLRSEPTLSAVFQTDRTHLYPDVFKHRFDWVSTRYLHVGVDGSEHWFDWPPEVQLCLRVSTFRAECGLEIEITGTFSIETYEGEVLTYKHIKPRGEGWEPFDTRHDKSSEWWRPKRLKPHQG